MKVWMTKYAITSGIWVFEAKLCDDMDTMISRIVDDREVGDYYHKPDWHTSEEAAIARFEVMKAAKLKSIDKQRTKLLNMKPSINERSTSW